MPQALAEIPIAVLSSLIARTIFAISSEESRFSLNGALLILKERGVAMVSTDGHRLAYAETQQELTGIKAPSPACQADSRATVTASGEHIVHLAAAPGSDQR